MEFGRIGRQMEIEPTVNKGFILRVGCAVLVFTDYQDLLQALAEYWSDPEAVEKQYDRVDYSEPPPPPGLRTQRGPIARAFNEGFDPAPNCEKEPGERIARAYRKCFNEAPDCEGEERR